MAALVKIGDDEFAALLLTGAGVIEMTRIGVLPEGRGHELVEGVLVSAASQLGPHVRMVGTLLRNLIQCLPETYAISPGPSIFLSERTMLEPDICIYPDAMESTDLRGPDILLAIEVSDTTLAYDTGRKKRLYAAHGVAHYWVVDLNGGQLIRYGGPSGERYLHEATHALGDTVALPFVDQAVSIPAPGP